MARDRVRRYRREKLFWRVMTCLVCVLAWRYPALWQSVSIIYVAVVSNYALDLTAATAEQAAEAARNSSSPKESA